MKELKLIKDKIEFAKYVGNSVYDKDGEYLGLIFGLDLTTGDAKVITLKPRNSLLSWLDTEIVSVSEFYVDIAEDTTTMNLTEGNVLALARNISANVVVKVVSQDGFEKGHPVTLIALDNSFKTTCELDDLEITHGVSLFLSKHLLDYYRNL